MKNVRFFGFIGIIGEILLLIIFVSLHILNPDISPFVNYISDYANSPYGTLFKFSLFIHGIGMLAIATGLAISLPQSRFKKLGVIFLVVAAVGTILGGIFSIDPLGATKSIEGTIHQIIVFLSFLSEVGAFFFLSCAFKNTLSWNSFKATTVLIVIISIISLFWFWVNISVIIGGFPGLAERIVFFVFFLWEILVAMRLLTQNGME